MFPTSIERYSFDHFPRSDRREGYKNINMTFAWLYCLLPFSWICLFFSCVLGWEE
jgi:hypothetical protein